MILKTVIGHPNQVKSLLQALSGFEDLPSRALLLTGPSGVGKKMVALGWAQGLLCESQNKPCGTCSSCLRVEKKNHPDLLIISPEDHATLKIESIRDVKSFASFKSFEGRGKVIIIDEAQNLTAQASNALLKILEEPSPQCNFVLVSSNKAAILATIQSRCQKIFFGPLSIKDVKKILPDLDESMISMSQGRVDMALKLENDTFKKLKSQCLGVLQNLSQARIFEGFTSLIPLIEDKDSSLFAIQCWARWLTQTVAYKLGAPVQFHFQEGTILKELAEKTTVSNLLILGQKILGLERDVQGNINKALVFEKFWLDAHNLVKGI